MLDQLRRDGQTQAGAAVFPGNRTVGLGESLEHLVVFLWRDADAGVSHSEMQDGFFRRQRSGFHFQDDLALFGKLDGVLDQIDDDLAQPGGIAHDVFENIGRHMASQLQLFLVGAECEDLHRIFQNFPEIELHAI
jgi:hypothetical protein